MSELRIQRRRTPQQSDLERRAVQGLASQVQDEAHWTAILSSATEEQRDELERVVGPMLPFRRAAVCTTPGCESGEPAVWQPVLEVHSPIDQADVAWVPIELRLCDTCKGEAKLADFLTDAIWRQIMQAWHDSTLPPTKRLTTLTFDRVH